MIILDPQGRSAAHRGRWLLLGAAAGVLVAAASVLALSQYATPSRLVSPAASGPTASTTSTPAGQVPAPMPKRLDFAQLRLPALPLLPTPPPVPSPPVLCPTPSPGTTPPPTAGTCVPCGEDAGTNPSQAEIAAALEAAAAQYQLPVNLLSAVAWQESKWHEDVTSCDGGLGLMQVQYYTVPWLNALSLPVCGLEPTQYDAPSTSVEDNAFLGAKYLKWLQCLYAYNGPGGGSPSAPANGGSAYYYAQARLAYPDTQTLHGTPISTVCPEPAPATPTATLTAGTTPSPTTTLAPSPTPSPTPTPTGTLGGCSLCLTLYENNGNGPEETTYQDLPSLTSDPWSCPIDPTKGVGDYELLDLVLSAYNAGPGTVSACACLPNLDYVGTIEYWVTEFAIGALPSRP
jgi:hypothetical protein